MDKKSVSMFEYGSPAQQNRELSAGPSSISGLGVHRLPKTEKRRQKTPSKPVGVQGSASVSKPKLKTPRLSEEDEKHITQHLDLFWKPAAATAKAVSADRTAHYLSRSSTMSSSERHPSSLKQTAAIGLQKSAMGQSLWDSVFGMEDVQLSAPDTLKSMSMMFDFDLSDVEKAIEDGDISKAYFGFKKLKKEIESKGNVDDPAAVAASIGRKKYGAKAFQEMANEKVSKGDHGGMSGHEKAKEMYGEDTVRKMSQQHITKEELAQQQQGGVQKAKPDEEFRNPIGSDTLKSADSSDQKTNAVGGQSMSASISKAKSDLAEMAKGDDDKEWQIEEALGGRRKNPVNKALSARVMPRLPRAVAMEHDAWRSATNVMTRGNSRFDIDPTELTPDALAQIPEEVRKSSYIACKGCGRTYMIKSFPGGCPTCIARKAQAGNSEIKW